MSSLIGFREKPPFLRVDFYYIGVDVMKEFKTYQEQIELLKTRGLIIDDEQFVL